MSSGDCKAATNRRALDALLRETRKLTDHSKAANRLWANHALLKTLEALWETVPEQRFGQLVMNLSRVPHGFADTWEWSNADWHRRIEEAYSTWER